MSLSYTQWLNGPAAFIFSLGLIEDTDHYTLTATIDGGEIVRTSAGEGFFNAQGESLEFENLGTYTTGLVRTHAPAFQSQANLWMADIFGMAPEGSRLEFVATFTRIDAAPGGLTTRFSASGDIIPDDTIQSTDFARFAQELNALFANIEEANRDQQPVKTDTIDPAVAFDAWLNGPAKSILVPLLDKLRDEEPDAVFHLAAEVAGGEVSMATDHTGFSPDGDELVIALDKIAGRKHSGAAQEAFFEQAHEWLLPLMQHAPQNQHLFFLLVVGRDDDTDSGLEISLRLSGEEADIEEDDVVAFLQALHATFPSS